MPTSPALVSLTAASISRRILAKLIDILSVAAIVAPCAWIASRVVGAVAFGFAAPALILDLVLYTALAEHFFGHTFGKRIMGLDVVQESGARITLGQSFARQLPWLSDSVGLDALVALFTRQRQRAFEAVSHTRVVRVVPIVLLSLIAAVSSVSAQETIAPAPGAMVRVGDHRLHLNCTGTGTPTVVLEAGASSFSIDWALVQPAIATRTRVCSYDRAGYGWSEPAAVLPDPASDVRELHELLQLAGVRPPFVLVGASYGGMLVRLYADAHPTEVAGFVFIDPGHEDQLFTMLDGKTRTIASLSPDEFARTVPTADVDVPVRGPQTGEPFSRLAADLYATRIALETRTLATVPRRVSAATAAGTAENQWKVFAHLQALTTANAHPLGDRPTVVLTRGADSRPGLVAAHRHLAALSTNGTHQVVPGSGHEIHLFDPNVVIGAIDSVLDAVGSSGTIQSPRASE